jgi:hypothetical protein
MPSSGFGFAQILAQKPSTRCEVLKGCGHYLVLEQPEAAAMHIMDFLLRAASTGEPTTS